MEGAFSCVDLESYGGKEGKVSPESLAEETIMDHNGGMTLEISTPALLFPAVSLLFLSYTNRFLHLAALVRKLHAEWERHHLESARVQIDNLRRRLFLIRWMQLLGAVSLLLCVLSMLAILTGGQDLANGAFTCAIVLMSLSLASLVVEILISGGALRILLKQMEIDAPQKSQGDSRE